MTDGGRVSTRSQPSRRAGGGPRRAIVVILLAAFVLRVLRSGLVPPGLQFDEAHNAIDAGRVLGGDLRLFFPDNGGREPLVTYLHAAALSILGWQQAAIALRWTSAFVGMTTVAVLYGFAGRFLGRRLPTVLAAGFLAFTYWHLHFSRYGIRAILAPLWATAVMWAWWKAVGPVPDRARPPASVARSAIGAAIACGALLAASAYSHPSGRLLPLVLVAHTLWRAIVGRRTAVREVRALAVAGVTASILFAPLGLYFVRHPGQFTAHPSDVSLAAVAAAEHGGDFGLALLAQLRAIAGMLFVAGDPSTLHNLPGLPVFDPLTALWAVLGLGVVAAWLSFAPGPWRDRAVLLLAWLLVGLAPTAFSDRPPNYSRAMAALPVIVLLPALGLQWMLLRFSRPSPNARVAAAALALAAAGIWTGQRYFVAFPRLEHLFHSYDMDKVEAHAALRSLSVEANVFLHPLWSGQATFAWLNRDLAVRTMDGRDTVVLPADGRDTAIAFPAVAAEREGWYEDAEKLYGHAARRTRLDDSSGRELLEVLRLSPAVVGDLAPPKDAPLEPAVFDDVVFGDSVRLVGHTLGALRPGQPLDVVLVWQALRPIDRNLTVFVHLVGAAGESLGQDDREPAHASYRTSDWQSGDVVIDRFRPMPAPDADGDAVVVVGWYSPETGERLLTGDGADSVTLGAIGGLPRPGEG